MIEYTNSHIAGVIDEYIHNDRNRAILKDRFVDGWTYERIAEHYDMSVRHIKRIIYTSQDELFKHL